MATASGAQTLTFSFSEDFSGIELVHVALLQPAILPGTSAWQAWSTGCSVLTWHGVLVVGIAMADG